MKSILIYSILISLSLITITKAYNLESFVFEYSDSTKTTRNVFNGANIKFISENNKIDRFELFYYISSDDNFKKVREFFPEFSLHQTMDLHKGGDSDTSGNSGLKITIKGDRIKTLTSTQKDGAYTLKLNVIDLLNKDQQNPLTDLLTIVTYQDHDSIFSSFTNDLDTPYLEKNSKSTPNTNTNNTNNQQQNNTNTNNQQQNNSNPQQQSQAQPAQNQAKPSNNNNNNNNNTVKK